MLTIFFAFVYLATYSGAPHSPDEWFYLRGTQAALDGRWADIQVHGWLFSLLAVPLLALSASLPRIGAYQVTLLLNIPVTASTGGLVWLLLTELGADRRQSLGIALTYGLATLAWPYSHYFFREPMAGFFLTLSYWGLIRFGRQPGWFAVLVAGMAFLAGVAVKQTLLAFLPFIGLGWLAVLGCIAIRQRSGNFLSTQIDFWLCGNKFRERFLLWLGTLGGILLATWLLTLALPWHPGYLASGPHWASFLALWFSPGWGLIVYVPILLLSFLGVPDFARHYPVLALTILGGALFYILAASANPFWWGYWSFGPRQLLPLLPLLCLPTFFGWRWLTAHWGRWGIGIGLLLVGLSLSIQLVGVLTPFNLYTRWFLLTDGVTGPALAWDLQRWPLFGMLRFLSPETLDPAWLRGAVNGIQAHWALLLLCLTGAILALFWLIRLLYHSQETPYWPGRAILLALVLGWNGLALWGVNNLYLDPRYEPDLGYLEAATILRREREPGDLLVLDLWTENLTGPLVAMLNYCQGQCPERLDLVREDLMDRERRWQETRLKDLAGHDRVWLLLTRVPEGDPNSVVEHWLEQVGYLEFCRWTGPQVRLCLYHLGPGDLLWQGPVEARFGSDLRLVEAEVARSPAQGQSPVSVRPGQVILVRLTWQALSPVPEEYILSLQLIDKHGRLLTALDHRPGGSFRPMFTWQPEDLIPDRYALPLPSESTPGSYRLLAILYRPTDGQRLPVQQVDSVRGDGVLITSFEVVP